ncbi:hypothetical protein [Pseudoalteromonas sp. S1608]|uniref:hypothetical protein n=1 Tax=Pseudoalteromonas sp. S1608 TaxID=579504 RepID=UPI00110B60F4|nr:hypothetical protein [Pseudoalteromonas sp. S1608]
MKYFHRFNIVALIIISSVWACFAFQTNPFQLFFNFEILELLKFTYTLGFTVVFWPMFYLEVCDLIHTALGKNGKTYTKYFDTIKENIYVSSISALILACVYWTDSVKYDFSGVDLAFIGVPFLVVAIFNIRNTMKITVAGVPVRKTVLFFTLGLVLLFSYLSFSYLQNNSSGQYQAYQAIWFQITILFVSFWFYLSTSWQKYFINNCNIELSNFKRYFISEVSWKHSEHFPDAEEMAKKLNKKNRIAKAKYAKKKRKNN